MLHEINGDLKTAEATLKHWETNYSGVARAATNAEVEYEVALQNAIDDLGKVAVPQGQKAPTVDAIKARAFVKCEQLYRTYKETKSDLEVAKKLIGIAETKLTSIQTRVKIEQMEMSLS
jgi:hypothetical protein